MAYSPRKMTAGFASINSRQASKIPSGKHTFTIKFICPNRLYKFRIPICSPKNKADSLIPAVSLALARATGNP
ncbi:MAG: hypothetical protein ACLU4J_20130 [Butyricimonas paravirosa]